MRRVARPVDDLQRHLDLLVAAQRPCSNRAFLSSARFFAQPANFIETTALLLHIGVMLAFLILVLHSFLAPFQTAASGLGRSEMMANQSSQRGCRIRPRQDRSFTWKGDARLPASADASVACLEHRQTVVANCGVIMDLRDHWTKAPTSLGCKDGANGRKHYRWNRVMLKTVPE